jgi:hypothetical protein
MKKRMTKEVFEPLGYHVPANIKVTCGFPSKKALSKKNRRIGEIWASQCSAGNFFETMIHPSECDSVNVSAILAHEICHAIVGVGQGHNRRTFGKVARAIGLEGSLTATYAGEALIRKFCDIIDEIGGYPHKQLYAVMPQKKDHCRYIKLVCSTCDFYCLVSRKHIENLPTCGCGGEMHIHEKHTKDGTEEKPLKKAA